MSVRPLLVEQVGDGGDHAVLVRVFCIFHGGNQPLERPFGIRHAAEVVGMDRAVVESGKVLRGSLHRGGTGRALEDFTGLREGKIGETGKGIHGDEVTQRPERSDAPESGIDGGLQSGWRDGGMIKCDVHE